MTNHDDESVLPDPALIEGENTSSDINETPISRVPNHPEPIDSRRLSEACDNATELVSYLSSKGNLPDTIVTDDFFKILGKARSGKLEPSEEPEFWSNYSQLATHAKPVQIEALKFRNYMLDRNKADSRERAEYKRSLNDIVKIRWISLTSFVFTLILLTYVSLTSTYLSTNKKLTDEAQQIEAQVFEGTRLYRIDKATKSTPSNFGDSSGNESSDGNAIALGEPVFVENENQDTLIALRQNAIAEINYHIEYNLSALDFLQLNTASFARSTNTDTTEQLRFSKVLLLRAQIEAHQGLINQLISSYLLPLFTSLLGVTVFILRRTSASLNSGQYRPYESSTYSYRLTLGVVGGIVISWFSTADTTGVVASLTPAALAFVVGYSIEVLYNVLDSIVKALGASDK
ncbi:MAG: hypothetical protein ABJO86_05520 [Lentilitoribacter sp.]